MVIPKEIIEKWERLYSPGDVKLISEWATISPTTVYNAFKHKKCSYWTLVKIADFYAEREAILSQYMD